jgi:arginase
MPATPSVRTHRPISILGAPSNIGIRPYDDGEVRGLDRAPAVLRDLALADRIGAADRGDVSPPRYRDFARQGRRPRNEAGVVRYSRDLADSAAELVLSGQFVVLLGGDCSIVLGALLGARRAVGRVGLAYVDAHADFATPAESATGSAASMCLAMAVGRGDTPLARLGGDRPLVCGEDVVLVGRRDHGEPYGQHALVPWGILDLPGDSLEDRWGAATADVVLERLGAEGVGGFWIHVDADVLDASIMSAVDSPTFGGPDVAELSILLRALAAHPGALGLQLTIYDPVLDPELDCARRLAALIESVFISDEA